MKKLLTSLIILLVPAFMLAAAAAKPATSVTGLISQLSHGQAKVTKSFKAVDGMTGYVVSPTNAGGRSLIMFGSKSGKYLVVGNIIALDGTNVTQEYTQKYVNSAIAAKSAKTIENSTHYFEQGSAKAPHKMYVFFDPNCSACHLFYESIYPSIQKGQVQVRWIPVAFLKPSSTGKAAAILNGSNDAARAKLLHEDEKGFDMKTETGGLKPMAKSNKSFKKLAAMVKSNTDYFGKQGFYATPTIIYNQVKDGKSTYMAGAIPPSGVADFLAKVNNKW